MKYLLAFLGMVPCLSFASGFGDEEANTYILMFIVVWTFLVPVPLGLLGGFLAFFLTQRKYFGFLGVSVVLAVLMFLLPSSWGIDVGFAGFLIYLFCEVLLVFSFLVGWWFSGFLLRVIQRLIKMRSV